MLLHIQYVIIKSFELISMSSEVIERFYKVLKQNNGNIQSPEDRFSYNGPFNGAK